jgi:hypothetical protein
MHRAEPGSSQLPGNQATTTCIPWAWTDLVQPTNRPLSPSPFLVCHILEATATALFHLLASSLDKSQVLNWCHTYEPSFIASYFTNHGIFCSKSSLLIHTAFFRFKLILGRLQLDNQLPLSTMPVILATEGRPDSNRPVFKANIAVGNVTSNGIQVYPHVYIRVMLLWCIFQQANLFYINLYWNNELVFSPGN